MCAAFYGMTDDITAEGKMISTEKKKNHVVNRVEGKVTLRELLVYAQKNTDTWVDEPVLWDITDGRLTEDTSDYASIRALLHNINELTEKRKGKKTVFLAPDPFTYGMLRMAVAIAECSASHFVAHVSSSRNEALNLLKKG